MLMYNLNYTHTGKKKKKKPTTYVPRKKKVKYNCGGKIFSNILILWAYYKCNKIKDTV